MAIALIGKLQLAVAMCACILISVPGCIPPPRDQVGISPGVVIYPVWYFPFGVEPDEWLEEVTARQSGKFADREGGFLRICMNFMEPEGTAEEMWAKGIQEMRESFLEYHDIQKGVDVDKCRYEFVDFAIFVKQESNTQPSGWLFGKIFTVEDLVDANISNETLSDKNGRFSFPDSRDWGHLHLQEYYDRHVKEGKNQ